MITTEDNSTAGELWDKLRKAFEGDFMRGVMDMDRATAAYVFGITDEPPLLTFATPADLDAYLHAGDRHDDDATILDEDNNGSTANS